MVQLSLDFKTEDFYYFFMKVGHGNCFLPLAGKYGFLWVGYFGEDIPNINEEGHCDNAIADLQYMTITSQSHLRDKIRILTYGKDSLLIWKPTGKLQYLHASKMNVDWSDPKLYSTFPRQWHKEMKSKYDHVGSPQFIKNYIMSDKGAKMLPVELACDPMPRASLLASIDSLSVWQSLNRRTYQPVFTLKGNETLADLDWLKQYKSLEPLSITKAKSLGESSFGKFIRLYFEEKFNQHRPISLSMPKEEISKTVLSVLNPSQLETAAMHLCKDLGFTIDVGLGKGLDVADIKATVRHLSSRDRRARLNHALTLLERTGVRFSEKLRCEIQATSTLRVQCKAYSDVDHRNLGSTLLVVPNLSNKENPKDCLQLEVVSKMNHKLFPELFGWLNLLESDLCHPRSL